MKQSITNCIPEIKQIYLNQSDSPLSPGHSTTTEYQFCAAACIAYVGLKNYMGEDSSNKYKDELMRLNHKSTITRAFEALGWGADRAENAMQSNDSFYEVSRKKQVLAYFDSLR